MGAFYTQFAKDIVLLSVGAFFFFVFFFFTLVTGPRRSLSLKLSDTKVYEPQIRDFLNSDADVLDTPVDVLDIPANFLNTLTNFLTTPTNLLDTPSDFLDTPADVLTPSPQPDATSARRPRHASPREGLVLTSYTHTLTS